MEKRFIPERALPPRFICVTYPLASHSIPFHVQGSPVLVQAGDTLLPIEGAIPCSTALALDIHQSIKQLT